MVGSVRLTLTVKLVLTHGNVKAVLTRLEDRTGSGAISARFPPYCEAEFRMLVVLTK